MTATVPVEGRALRGPAARRPGAGPVDVQPEVLAAAANPYKQGLRHAA